MISQEMGNKFVKKSKSPRAENKVQGEIWTLFLKFMAQKNGSLLKDFQWSRDVMLLFGWGESLLFSRSDKERNGLQSHDAFKIIKQFCTVILLHIYKS